MCTEHFPIQCDILCFISDVIVVSIYSSFLKPLKVIFYKKQLNLIYMYFYTVSVKLKEDISIRDVRKLILPFLRVNLTHSGDHVLLIAIQEIRFY